MSDDNIAVHEELRQISPLLGELSKDTLIEVPQDYFSTVEDQILSQLQLPKAKNVMEPAPDGYLENLEDEIIKKVAGTGNGTKQRHNIFKLFIGVAVAACLGVFLISRFSLDDTQVKDTDVAYEAIDYFDAYPQDIEDISVNQLIDNGIIAEEDISFVIEEENLQMENIDPIFHSDAPF
jgi:hypothetical protein